MTPNDVHSETRRYMKTILGQVQYHLLLPRGCGALPLVVP
jgi:hypothetical protein